MTGTVTTGTGGGPLRRHDAHVGERLQGAPQGLVTDVADEVRQRIDAGVRFTELKADAEARPLAGPGQGRRRLAPDIALVADATGGPNWVPIGPSAVTGGQAAGLPVVSGRVQDMVMSADGQRIYLATAEGGLWRSYDAGRTWEAMSDVYDLLEPAGTRARSATLATGAVGLAEGGSGVTDLLYIGTGEPQAGIASAPDLFGVGMLRSTDGGATLAQESSAPDLVGRACYAIAVDPRDKEHAVVATRVGLYRRTAANAAGGAAWRVENMGPGAASDVTSVVGGSLAGATAFWASVMGGGIFQWTAGAWTALPALPAVAALPAGAGRVTLALSAGDPGVLYALAATPLGAPSPECHLYGVFRLDLGAVAAGWRTVTGAPSTLFGRDPAKQGQGWYDQAIVVDPTDSSVVYVGGSTMLTDGEFGSAIYRLDVTLAGAGASCTATPIGGSAHADVHALTMRPGVSRELWTGTDGGVYVSLNPRGTGGRSFESRNTGLATLTLVSLAVLPGEDSWAFAGAQDNGGLRYTGSEVWEHQLLGDGGNTVVDFARRDRIINGYINTSVRRAQLAGARDTSDQVSPPAVRANFYPPIVGVPAAFAAADPTTATNPSDATMVAFGGEVPYVSTNFAGAWNALANRTPASPTANVRSLAFASPNLLWAGWTDGHLARYDRLAEGWVCTDVPRPTERRPVTSIAIDPAVPNGEAVYVTFGGASGGGDRVWHVSALLGGATPPLPPPAGVWTSSSTGLLDIQHNAVVVDPTDANKRWVGTDLGVWQWDPTGAGTWRVQSSNLPDTAVQALSLLPGGSLLRAVTYGRGVWELDLTPGAHAPVQLLLRAGPADRSRPARTGRALPTAGGTARLDASPDIVVDAPGADGRTLLDPASRPSIVDLTRLAGRREVLVGVPEAPASTRVHVTVRTSRVRPGNARLDGVRVALLVGPAGASDDDAPERLPSGFAAAARDGTPVDGDGWHTVGIVTVDGIRPGSPGLATFELPSTLLPPVSESSGKRFALLALTSHTDDPLPAAPVRDPLNLVTAERRAALLRVTAVGASTAASGSAVPPAGTSSASAGSTAPAAAGGGPLLIPLTTALLAHQRIGDVADQLTRKIRSSVVRPGRLGRQPVAVRPVERRVLALARAALAQQRGGPTAAVPDSLPGSGIGQYTLLGALGFELAGFAAPMAPDGGWLAEVLRRGTPDPDRSRVNVPSAELALAVASAGTLAAASDADALRAVRAVASGMLSATAAGTVVGPQLADLLARDTRRDWHRTSRSSGAAAVDRHLRRRFLGGDGPSPLGTWLPPAAQVPDAVWTGYLTGIEDTYGTTARRPHGFPEFETRFRGGAPLDAKRLRNAYTLVSDDLRNEHWPAIAWFGLLSPILLAPSMAMLAAHALPHGEAFFTEKGDVGERAVFELLTLSMGIGSVAPFVYSMILWGAAGDDTEAYVTALLAFLARAGLVTGALASSGDASQSAVARWLGLFTPLIGIDIWSATRAGMIGSDRPAASAVLGLQTLPALTGVAALSVSSLLKAAGISHGWPFWLAWSLFTGAAWLGAGIPLSIGLAGGGSWRSWLLRSPRGVPLTTSVAAHGLLPVEPVAAARVLDDSLLWRDPDALPGLDLDGYDHASGARPLVRVWWEGAGTLEVRYGRDEVALRTTAGETLVRLPAGTTAASLAQLLLAAVPGVRAEVMAPGTPDPALPWPTTLADPGVDGPLSGSAVAAARYVPAGTTKETALVLRHAPRADLSTRAGLVAGSDSGPAAFPVVPLASLGDLEGSGLGVAADLAVLLALAAAPSLEPVVVDDLLPALPTPAVTEVVQVFRRWNLDERRYGEWQQLVTGGATPTGAPSALPDPLLRHPPSAVYAPQPVGEELVAAMGWIPLWRAWLRVATDVQADTDAATVLPSTPLVRFRSGAVRRPTNAELTEGVRFLLDLTGS